MKVVKENILCRPQSDLYTIVSFTVMESGEYSFSHQPNVSFLLAMKFVIEFAYKAT